MVFYVYVFRSLMELRVLHKTNSALIIYVYDYLGVAFLHLCPMSCNKFLNHIASRVAVEAAMYSDSVVLKDTSFCRCDDQDTSPFAMRNA